MRSSGRRVVRRSRSSGRHTHALFRTERQSFSLSSDAIALVFVGAPREQLMSTRALFLRLGLRVGATESVAPYSRPWPDFFWRRSMNSTRSLAFFQLPEV
jgi:hypothetical protein